MSQQHPVDFSFNAKELVEVEKMLIKYGSILCVMIEWAIRRGCRTNAHQVQCIAQIVTRVQQLGGAKAFIEDMKANEMKQQANSELQASEDRIKAMISAATANVPVSNQVSVPPSEMNPDQALGPVRMVNIPDNPT